MSKTYTGRCECCGTYPEEGTVILQQAYPCDDVEVCEHCARMYFERCYDYDLKDGRAFWFDLRHAQHLGEWRNVTCTPFYWGPANHYRFGHFILDINLWSWCELCGSPMHKSSLDPYDIDGKEVQVCSYCAEESAELSDYLRCENCGIYTHPDNARWSESDDDYICSDCYDRDYFTCEECGCVFHERNLEVYNDRYLCESCERDARRQDEEYDSQDECEYIYPYSYKPRPIVHKTDADVDSILTVGVELEFNHADWHDQNRHSDFIHEEYDMGGEPEDLWYQKSDSSLNNGIEAVSHPCTLNYWKAIEPRMAGLLRESERYIDDYDCGLHVHIYRRAMNKGHRVRFGAFFELCREQVEKIARRKSNSYASFLPDWKWEDEIHNSKQFLAQLAGYRMDRYRAVNWCNDKTAEVRVFRSTTSAQNFYAAIELVHAVYQYTKHAGWRSMWCAAYCGGLWGDFVEFARSDARYNNLVEFIDGYHVEA